MRLAVEFDQNLGRWLDHLDGSLPRAAATGARRILLHVGATIQRRIKAGDDLTARSGSLGRSWLPRGGANLEVREDGPGAVGVLGSDHPAARVQNVGGVIKPVRANMLAIPVHPSLKTKGAGVGKVASPRQIPGLFVVVSRKGNVLLVKRSATKVRYMADTVRDAKGRYKKAGRYRPVSGLRYGIEPWFLLVKQVTLPPTGYLDHAVEEAGPKFGNIMEDAIRERIGKVLLT